MESGPKMEEGSSYKSTTAKKARLQSMLSALLDDPILSDVPKKPSLSDVDILIDLELGSAMKISVVRMDNTSFGMHLLSNILKCDLDSRMYSCSSQPTFIFPSERIFSDLILTLITE